MIKKLRSRYQEIPLPAKASLWFVVCSLFQKGITFITTPFFTRMLSTSEYGETVLYSSWMEIVTIFATFQLSSGVFNKAMIKYEDDRDGYTSSSLFLASSLTVLLFVIYICTNSFGDKLFDLSKSMMIMMFIDIFFSTAMSFWSIRNRFEFKYINVVIFTFLVAIIGPLSSVAFIRISDVALQAEAKVFGLLLVKIVIYGFIFAKIFLKGKKFIDLHYWKYSVLYNIPLIPHYLSQQVLTQSDRIMISFMCGKGDAAIYGIAYQLSMVAFMFTYAIHNSFTPWSFEKLKKREYTDIGDKAIIIEIVIGLMCFFLSLVAPELIYILGGKRYETAIWIVPPVAMSVLFQTIYSLFGNVEFYYEKTWFVMIASIICAISNLILNYLFIPQYGFVAAGYTTLVCYVLYAFVHYCFMKRILKAEEIESIYNGRLMWGIGGGFVSLSIIASVLYNYTALRYLLIFLIFAVLVFTIWTKRMDLINR